MTANKKALSPKCSAVANLFLYNTLNSLNDRCNVGKQHNKKATQCNSLKVLTRIHSS